VAAKKERMGAGEAEAEEGGEGGGKFEDENRAEQSRSLQFAL
jgi:hypothetical protein